MPEKIILSVDITSEMSELFTKSKTKLQVAAQALKKFVTLKSSIYSNSQTEFALILLTPSGAQWMIDFTSDHHYILSAIDGLTVAIGEEDKVLDMSQFLQLVQEHFQAENGTFLRVFCIFGRSIQIPIFSMGRDGHSELLQHPGFGIDILYLHQKPREENFVREVFDALGAADQNGHVHNYLFARHHKAQLVMRDVAMLLQHPGLRKSQPKNFDAMKEMIRFGMSKSSNHDVQLNGSTVSNVVVDAIASNEVNIPPPSPSTVVEVLQEGVGVSGSIIVQAEVVQ